GAASLAPGTVYAPHVYTLAFTGDDASRASITKDTLRPSNASAREEAQGYAAPFVVTEFGFSPSAPNFADYVRWKQELEEQQLAVYDATCDGAPIVHGSLDPESFDCGGAGEHALVITGR